MPAADEVSRLQRGQDAEGELFRKVSEKGHYGGREIPTNTRQGIYAMTPNGVFLASINHQDPARIAQMLTLALENWNKLTPEERLPKLADIAPEKAPVRFERFYPADGLVLRMTARDLPRTSATADDWRGQAWNTDFAWFRKAEVRSMLPEVLQDQMVQTVPQALVARLVQQHLIDVVRGQAPPFEAKDVQEAKLITKISKVEGGVAIIRIEGRTMAATRGRWPVDGFKDMNAATEQTRGIELNFLGRAKFNLKTEKFEMFELVGIGSRWGATQYNGRADDRAPALIGFVFQMAKPNERVAPANYWGYGWR